MRINVEMLCSAKGREPETKNHVCSLLTPYIKTVEEYYLVLDVADTEELTDPTGADSPTETDLTSRCLNGRRHRIANP